MCVSEEFSWLWSKDKPRRRQHRCSNTGQIVSVFLLLFLQRKQEERVQQVRKKLEEALMADILSRAADAEAVDLEVDSGDDA